MKHLVSIIILAIMGFSAAQAQNITGKIVNDQNQPVEFANVVIFNKDSVFLGGTISDFDGKFSVEKPANAEYISLSCIGYENVYKRISEISDFQNIVMKNSAVELQEVTVKALAPKTTLKDGAMVTNVQGTVLAQTGSTTRMLENVPGLMKGRSGGLEVIGKG